MFQVVIFVIKLNPSGGSISSPKFESNGTSSIAKGILKLNAIPLSLSAYRESLSDDQKRLLRLECEIMGKSWLKVLKDEFRKPYSISLKAFLWKEGLPDVQNTSPMLKIFILH